MPLLAAAVGVFFMTYWVTTPATVVHHVRMCLIRLQLVITPAAVVHFRMMCLIRLQ